MQRTAGHNSSGRSRAQALCEGARFVGLLAFFFYRVEISKEKIN